MTPSHPAEGRGGVSARPSMTGGEASVQGRRPLPFCCEAEAASQPSLAVSDATKSAPPPPLARRSGCACAALTAAPPPRPRRSVLDGEDVSDGDDHGHG